LLATVIKDRERAEERFTKAFQSSPDAMLISRVRDGQIIDVNECWESVFAYRREEVIGKTLTELNIYASELDRERLAACTSEPGRQLDVEVRLRTKTGELRQTLISADTEAIAGEMSMIVIVRDITERRQIEEARQALAHGSRLATVGELTALIAHEINQPLGAILSNAETAELLLGRKEPDLDQVRRILSDIRANDLRASETIRSIRNLLRKRDIILQPLDLNEPVREVLRLVQSDALVRRVKLYSELEGGLPSVRADGVLMQQVILNLILNGIEALESVPEARRRLTVQTRRQNGAVEVAVSDSGEGITPEKQARLFDSFFTTKKDGMGLGLAISRSIIDVHRGKIWVETNSVGGATLRFAIPTGPESLVAGKQALTQS